MTLQQPERLVYAGEERKLCSTPLEPHLASMERPPELGGPNSSLSRRYVGSWKIDDDLLLLTGIEGTYLNLTPVTGLTGWVGLSGYRQRGLGPVVPIAGFVDLPLPEGLQPYALTSDLRWLTFDRNEVVLGVPAPMLDRWASMPEVHIDIVPAARELRRYERNDGRLGSRFVGESGGPVRTLDLADATFVDPTASVSLFELRNLWIDLDDADRSEWDRFAVRGPDEDGGVDWLEGTCCLVGANGAGAWCRLDELTVYRPDPRPLRVADVFPGQSPPIQATWFSGELRIVEGDQVSFRNRGFESVYEIETFLTVDQGRLTETRVEHHSAPPPR